MNVTSHCYILFKYSYDVAKIDTNVLSTVPIQMINQHETKFHGKVLSCWCYRIYTWLVGSLALDQQASASVEPCPGR